LESNCNWLDFNWSAANCDCSCERS